MTTASTKYSNFPLDDEGRTVMYLYHVHTKLGQTANRIITVGDADRAWLIAKHLDEARSEKEFAELKSKVCQMLSDTIPSATVEPAKGGDITTEKRLFAHLSSRGFLTITGTYYGTPVSIVAIGMGVAMMDFFVREVRMVTAGPLAIIRFGSCGAINTEFKVGQVAIATEAAFISRNYDYFTTKKGEPYSISGSISADPKLVSILSEKLTHSLVEDLPKGTPSLRVVKSLNITADSFYSSQGRQDPNFVDDNENLISLARKQYNDAGTLEMETFMLYHLANSAKKEPQNKISAASCTMIIFERFSGNSLSKEGIKKLEEQASMGLLRAIVAYDFS